MKKLIILLAVLLIAIQLFGWDGFGQSRGTNFTQRWMELTDSLTLVNTITEFSVDGTLAGNSDDAVPTEKAVKAYVDGAAGTVIWSRTGTTISPTNAGDDIDGTGGYLLDSQSITNLASKGASYWFDGVDDNISMTGGGNLAFGTGDFSVIMIIKANSLGATQRLLYGSTNSFGLIISASNKIVGSKVNVAGLTASTGTIELDKTTMISYIRSGTTGTYYINGIQAGTTIDSNDYTVDTSTICGTSDSFDGEVHYVKFFNTALTATEVKDLYSGAELPYRFIGASQTEFSGGYNDIASWTDVGSVTKNADNFITVGTATGIRKSVLELGKRYRITVVGTSTAGDFRVRTYNVNQEISGALTGSFSGTFEFTADDDELYFRNSEASTTTFTEITLTQIGNVANYSSDGVGHNTWSDVSGNNLYGTVSGAMAINMEYQQDIVRQNTITGDTQILSSSNIVPAGYMLKYMFGLETAGNTATLDLGTSAGGSQVFSQQAFTASTETCVDIGILFSRTADTALYLNDDGVGTWNSGSLNVIFVLERVQ